VAAAIIYFPPLFTPAEGHAKGEIDIRQELDLVTE
jgi:hypothetical protein